MVKTHISERYYHHYLFAKKHKHITYCS